MPKQCFEEMEQEVRKILAQVAETSEEEISDDADLANDLGVDSMMALEIVVMLEKKYKIKIPEQRIPTIRSFRNVLELLEELLEQ
ncbi:acyl carrier protein [Candidatus Omnitrophota bacterium]